MKNQVASLVVILDKFHELSKKIQKIQHNTFCCSVEKFNSWCCDPPRTLGLVPPMRRHRRETTTSCPHRTTPPLVNRERCTGDAKLDGWLAHGKLGRLVDGELQVNSIVPLLASASLLPSSEWHLLALTLHLLCLTATSTRLQLSISCLTRPKFLPFPCLGDAQRVCMANHLALVLTWC